MRNFTEEHLHVIENVGCRCKICEGSIFKSQKRQDVDAIYMTGRLKSICKFEKKQVADTSVKKKTMQSSELESGLPDEAPAGVHSLFLACGCRELNSKSLLTIQKNLL